MPLAAIANRNQRAPQRNPGIRPTSSIIVVAGRSPRIAILRKYAYCQMSPILSPSVKTIISTIAPLAPASVPASIYFHGRDWVAACIRFLALPGVPPYSTPAVRWVQSLERLIHFGVTQLRYSSSQSRAFRLRQQGAYQLFCIGFFRVARGKTLYNHLWIF